MALGVVRDKVSESVPPQMQQNFADLMDRVTTKLGGQLVPPGAMLGRGEDEYEESNGSERARSMGMG